MSLLPGLCLCRPFVWIGTVVPSLQIGPVMDARFFAVELPPDHLRHRDDARRKLIGRRNSIVTRLRNLSAIMLDCTQARPGRGRPVSPVMCPLPWVFTACLTASAPPSWLRSPGRWRGLLLLCDLGLYCFVFGVQHQECRDRSSAHQQDRPFDVELGPLWRHGLSVHGGQPLHVLLTAELPGRSGSWARHHRPATSGFWSCIWNGRVKTPALGSALNWNRRRPGLLQFLGDDPGSYAVTRWRHAGSPVQQERRHQEKRVERSSGFDDLYPGDVELSIPRSSVCLAMMSLLFRLRETTPRS